MRYLLLVLLLLLVSVPAQAGRKAAFMALANAKSVRCDLATGTTAYLNERHVVEMEPAVWADTPSESQIVFDRFDTKAGKARFSSKAGATDVNLAITGGGLNFIETTTMGSVNTSTVMPIVRSGRYFMVMSRHIILFGEPTVSQFYGWCTITDPAKESPAD